MLAPTIQASQRQTHLPEVVDGDGGGHELDHRDAHGAAAETRLPERGRKRVDRQEEEHGQEPRADVQRLVDRDERAAELDAHALAAAIGDRIEQGERGDAECRVARGTGACDLAEQTSAELRARPDREREEEPEAQQLGVGADPGPSRQAIAIARATCADELVIVSVRSRSVLPMIKPASISTTEAMPKPAN